MSDGAPAPAIVTQSLTRHFGAVRALRGIDLSITRGETLAVFGPNGAGKTTLVRILTLGLRPSSGSFTLDGLDPRRDGRRLRGRLGVISHQTYLYDDLSARQNLVFWGRIYGVPDPTGRADDLLEEVGLDHRAEDTVGTFSRGMQQRLALARSLVHDPPVVFLDEPFTGLDPHAARMLRDILGRLKQEGRTVLMVTHDLARGLELGDRWCVLVRGRITDTGASSETEVSRLERDYFVRMAGPGGSR